MERCPYGEVSVLERFSLGEVFVWRGVRLVSVLERFPYGEVCVLERCPY